jgi:hypothetical protein
MGDLSASTAFVLKNELDLFKSNTKVNIELQRVGLGFYSSGNRFMQRGTGGQFALSQKIGSKLNFKSKVSYRQSEDSNRTNSNLSTYASLKYKINKSSSVEARMNYFQNKIEFYNLFSNMNTSIYSLTWNQRIKIKKSYHQFVTIAQYSSNDFKSSAELNNSGLARNVQVLTNYNTIVKNITISAFLEHNANIDSNFNVLRNGLNLSYPISTMTNVGLGLNSSLNQNQFFLNGSTLSFNTSIHQLGLAMNISSLHDRLLNSTIISPLIRLTLNII